MRNDLPGAEAFRTLVRHLLRERRGIFRHARSCPACRAILDLLPLRPRRETVAGGGSVLPWRPAAADYGAAIDGVLRAFEPCVEAVSRERREAPDLLAELLRHPPARRFLLVRNSARFRSLVLGDLLLRAAREEGGERPDAAEELARLALAALDVLDAAFYGERVLADFRARAWALLAEVRRGAGDLAGARAALVAGLHHLRRGTGDGLERAQLRDQVAALRREQGRTVSARAAPAPRIGAAPPPRPPAARSRRRSPARAARR